MLFCFDKCNVQRAVPQEFLKVCVRELMAESVYHPLQLSFSVSSLLHAKFCDRDSIEAYRRPPDHEVKDHFDLSLSQPPPAEFLPRHFWPPLFNVLGEVSHNLAHVIGARNFLNICFSLELGICQNRFLLRLLASFLLGLQQKWLQFLLYSTLRQSCRGRKCVCEMTDF
jgi:hypothetical protein